MRRRSTTSTRAVDDAFGRVLAALPPGADVIVTSAGRHGRQHQPRRPAAGDARPGARGRPGRRRRGRRDLAPARGAARVACGRGSPPRSPTARRSSSPPGSSCAASTGPPPAPSPTRPTTRATCGSTSRGRERDGIVDPAEAGALRDEIAAGLATFTDPDGAPGGRVVVQRAAELYPGARADRLPDLVVRWAQRPADDAHRAALAALRRGPPPRQRLRALGQPHARATPGRWWCPGRRAHAARRPRRRGSWTWRRRCARSRAPTRLACPGGRC